MNEKLFGVKASFDEDLYTTKLDRNAPDFKEKEKKAQQLANEILAVRVLVFAAIMRVADVACCILAVCSLVVWRTMRIIFYLLPRYRMQLHHAVYDRQHACR